MALTSPLTVKIADPDGSYLLDLGTWEDAVEIASREPWDPDRDRQSRSGSFSFTLSNNFEEAAHLALYGWPDGRDRIRAAEWPSAREIMGWNDDPSGARELDVAGSEVDLDAYLDGDPECQWEFCEGPVRSPVVTLLVNTGVSWNIETEWIIRRGLAICSLIDALEEQGLRVELRAYDSTKRQKGEINYKKGQLGHSFQIKAADAHLDRDKAVFVLAHPSAQRRIMFGVQEQHENDTWKGYMRRNYGTPVDLPENDIPADTIHVGILYREQAGQHFATDEAAFAWVREQVLASLAKVER